MSDERDRVRDDMRGDGGWIMRAALYCGHPFALACDAKCHLAFGFGARPTVTDGEAERDMRDDELPGEAPANPGSSEGCDSKPQMPSERLNRWCARACERAVKHYTGFGPALPTVLATPQSLAAMEGEP